MSLKCDLCGQVVEKLICQNCSSIIEASYELGNCHVRHGNSLFFCVKCHTQLIMNQKNKLENIENSLCNIDKTLTRMIGVLEKATNIIKGR